MEIYVFDKTRVDNRDLDDGEGNGVSLSSHIRYVMNYMGTPDCIDIVTTKSDLKQYLDDEKYVLVDADTGKIL